MIYLSTEKISRAIELLNYLYFRKPKYKLSDFINHLELKLEEQSNAQPSKRIEHPKAGFADKDIKKTIQMLHYLHNQEHSEKLNDFIANLESEFDNQRMMTREETDEMVAWALKNVK